MEEMGEREPRGAKRSLDDWEEDARTLRSSSDESHGGGASWHRDGRRTVGDIESVREVRRDHVRRVVLDEEMVKKERAPEMEMFRKHGVYTKVPMEE